MSAIKGILFIPYNINGSTLKNIISVVLNPVSREACQLPVIDKILFLESPNPGKMTIGEYEYSAAEGCEQILRGLGVYEMCQSRRKAVANPASIIPSLILDAVREVGKENIIIDLTNGKKDMTGALYASACISELGNIIYVDVKKDADAHFYALDAVDPLIMDKFSLTRFDSLGEMEGLASASYIEFIRYRTEISLLGRECPGAFSEELRYRLNLAVGDYFSDNFSGAVSHIGTAHEKLIARIGLYLARHYDASILTINGSVIGKKNMDCSLGDLWKEARTVGPRIKLLLAVQEKYISLLERGERRNEEESAKFDSLHRFFHTMPTAFHFSEAVRVYRNQAAHGGSILVNCEDVKLMLAMLLKIIHGCEQNNSFSEIMRNEE